MPDLSFVSLTQCFGKKKSDEEYGFRFCEKILPNLRSESWVHKVSEDGGLALVASGPRGAGHGKLLLGSRLGRFVLVNHPQQTQDQQAYSFQVSFSTSPLPALQNGKAEVDSASGQTATHQWVERGWDAAVLWGSHAQEVLFVPSRSNKLMLSAFPSFGEESVESPVAGLSVMNAGGTSGIDGRYVHFSGSRIVGFELHQTRITCLAVGAEHDGVFGFAVTGDESGRIGYWATNEKMDIAPQGDPLACLISCHEGPVLAVQPLRRPDGEERPTFATGGVDGVLRIWSLVSDAHERKINCCWTVSVPDCQVTSMGTLSCTSNTDPLLALGTWEGALWLFKVPFGKGTSDLQPSLEATMIYTAEPVAFVALAECFKTGPILVAADRKGYLQMYRQKSIPQEQDENKGWHLTAECPLDSPPAMCQFFLPEGEETESLLACSAKGMVRLWATPLLPTEPPDYTKEEVKPVTHPQTKLPDSIKEEATLTRDLEAHANGVKVLGARYKLRNDRHSQGQNSQMLSIDFEQRGSPPVPTPLPSRIVYAGLLPNGQGQDGGEIQQVMNTLNISKDSMEFPRTEPPIAPHKYNYRSKSPSIQRVAEADSAKGVPHRQYPQQRRRSSFSSKPQPLSNLKDGQEYPKTRQEEKSITVPALTQAITPTLADQVKTRKEEQKKAFTQGEMLHSKQEKSPKTITLKSSKMAPFAYSQDEVKLYDSHRQAPVSGQIPEVEFDDMRPIPSVLAGPALNSTVQLKQAAQTVKSQIFPEELISESSNDLEQAAQFAVHHGTKDSKMYENLVSVDVGRLPHKYRKVKKQVDAAYLSKLTHKPKPKDLWVPEREPLLALDLSKIALSLDRQENFKKEAVFLLSDHLPREETRQILCQESLW